MPLFRRKNKTNTRAAALNRLAREIPGHTVRSTKTGFTVTALYKRQIEQAKRILAGYGYRMSGAIGKDRYGNFKATFRK